ncbi:LppU/SCO3897 family protein [Streptomyces caniferus]|uniref:LppU/SCO3897 family protein n=1 Tax=Streptomyces caniferus TaxID=285557 RepID=UPI003810954D
MSAPPPYQNQPQQPYGYPQQQQQQYGYPQQQQPYGYPQQPQGPQGPQGPQRQSSPLRGLITAVIVLAIFGGGAWYVWDYNTNPHGGKAKKEAAQAARAEENKKYDPQVGDCVKVHDPQGEPRAEIVDCGSAEAEYKTGDKLFGAGERCGSKFDYGIHVSIRHSTSYTLCFTKV